MDINEEQMKKEHEPASDFNTLEDENKDEGQGLLKVETTSKNGAVPHEENSGEPDGDSNTISGQYEYDEALNQFGDGRYQLYVYGLLVLVTWSTSFNNNGYIFIGAEQAFTCLAPGRSNITNATSNQYNVINDNQCHYRIATVDENGNETNGTTTYSSQIKCDTWSYDTTYFTKTMGSEWDINRCTDKWKINLANSIYMIGFLIGCFILAELSDRYGRKKLLMISCIGMLISGVSASFSVHYAMLTVLRFLLGVFTAGARNASFVYTLEFVAPKRRAAAGMVCGVVYSTGGILVTVFAHLLPNWRHFQLACGLLMAIYLPMWWLLPVDSPRWLLSQGRHAEANRIFKRSAHINRVPFPEGFNVFLQHEGGNQAKLLSLIKTPNLRKLTAIISLCWFSVSAIFFGMNFNVGNLTGNIFTNNYLLQASGTLEFLGIWYLMLGRRTAVSSAFLLCTVMSVLVAIAANLNKVALIVFAMIGKLLIETNFEMIYVVTLELYPTTARVSAMGNGSAWARLGGAVSPYIVLLHDYIPNLPYVVFAVLAGVTGIVALLLPETMNMNLPDSVEEAEEKMVLNYGCMLSCGEKEISLCKKKSTTNSVLAMEDMEKI